MKTTLLKKTAAILMGIGFAIASPGARDASAQAFHEVGKLTASDGTAKSQFGEAVAASGDIVVVGDAQNVVGGAAAVYVFSKPASGWGMGHEIAKLTASDAGGGFGTSVAIDGDTIVVGAPARNGFQGAAYVFVKPASGWTSMTETARLTPSDPTASAYFGQAVAVSGTTVAVGAPGANSGQGKAYLYEMPVSGWTSATESFTLTSFDGEVGTLGWSLAMSADTLVAGAPFKTIDGKEFVGRAHVFAKPPSGWQTATETATLDASDFGADHFFGYSVAVAGDTVIVGAPSLQDPATPWLGAVYVYVKPPVGWSGGLTETAKLTQSDPELYSMFAGSLATDGSTIVVGSPSKTTDGETTLFGNGKIYLFAKPSAGWASGTETTTLLASDRNANIFSDGGVLVGAGLGSSVALSGTAIFATAPRDKIVANAYQGSAHVFDSAATTRAITIDTRLSGAQLPLTFTVTGTGCEPGTYTTVAMLSWVPGSSCVVAVQADTQLVNGVAVSERTVTAWNDGNTTNPRTFTAPSAATVYTGTVDTLYALTVSAYPVGAGTVTGGGFYKKGTLVRVHASSDANFLFRDWTSSPAVGSSTSADTALTMGDSAATATANFKARTTTRLNAVAATYGDAVTFTGTVTPEHPLAAGTVSVEVDGVVVGSVSVTSGSSYSVPYTILKPGGGYTTKATFTPTDATWATTSSATSGLNVNKRVVTLTPSDSNPRTVNTTSTTLASVTFAATLTPSPANAVVDVTKAVVTGTLRALVVGGATVSCSVTNTSAGVSTTCANVPVGRYLIDWTIGGDYFNGFQVTRPFEVTRTVPITIAGFRDPLSFSQVGDGCPSFTGLTSKTSDWTVGFSCAVTFATPISNGIGTQLVFSGWADGGTSNPRIITVPTAATTYTANFKKQYELKATVAPAGAGSVSGDRYYDEGATANVSATAATGYRFIGWTGPVASASSASTTVTMNAPVSITANFSVITQLAVAALSGQYSDAVTLSATITPANSTIAGSLQFKVDGVNAGSPVTVAGSGTYTTSYAITGAAGAHTISATFTPSNTASTSATNSNVLTVTKEDATVTPSAANAQTIKVNVAGGTAGPVVLAGTVAQAADGSLGDITKATVSVQLVPLVGSGTISCSVTNNAGSLTASCGSLPVNVYSVVWSIGGNYFSGPQVTSLLSVYDPSLGFVTGGGTVFNGGVVGEFALNVKYLKNGQIQGGLAYIEHRPTGDVVVKTNSLTSLSIVGNSAVLLAKATVNGAGGYSLQATLSDIGEPGVNRDLFGLAVGNVLAFGPTPIAGGNIQVPQGAK